MSNVTKKEGPQPGAQLGMVASGHSGSRPQSRHHSLDPTFRIQTAKQKEQFREQPSQGPTLQAVTKDY